MVSCSGACPRPRRGARPVSPFADVHRARRACGIRRSRRRRDAARRAGAILLANAVIGTAPRPATSRVLRMSALVLVLTVLPLAIIAALSLGPAHRPVRWTPSASGASSRPRRARIRLVGWWTAAKGRAEKFDDLPAPPDQARARLVRKLCPRAADPRLRAISANSRSSASPPGARSLKNSTAAWRSTSAPPAPAPRRKSAHGLARPAQARPRRARHQGSLHGRGAGPQGRQRGHARDAVAGRARRHGIASGLRESIAATATAASARASWTVVDDRRAMIAGALDQDDNVDPRWLMPNAKGVWQQDIHSRLRRQAALQARRCRVRRSNCATVERKQLYIDGKTVGEGLNRTLEGAGASR